jgi:hypothetical protein
MKKVGVLIFAVALVSGLVIANFVSFGRIGGSLFNFSMDFRGVHGSGNLGKESRAVSGFTSVEAGGIFQVEIVAQKDYSVEVEADDNLLPFITTEVDNGVLRIRTEKRCKTNSPMRIRIAAPDIEKLDISGAANVVLSGVKNTALAIESSGASKVNVSGETSKLTLDISGATKINADELKAVDAVIEASGASFISVNVSGDITSNVSGASKVVYGGTPSNVNTRKSGVSSVSAK